VRTRETVALGVGLLALAVAAGLALLPATPDTDTTVTASRLAAAVVALVAVGFAVRVVPDRDGADAATAWRPADPPEATVIDGERPSRAGTAVDGPLARLGDATTTERSRSSARWRVRARVREAVVATLRAEGYDREDALALVERGAWTDDPRAAAFLGGPEARDPPLRDRLRDWAAGDPFARGARAAVAAAERRADGAGPTLRPDPAADGSALAPDAADVVDGTTVDPETWRHGGAGGPTATGTGADADADATREPDGREAEPEDGNGAGTAADARPAPARIEEGRG
jgi:hypothetical protein